MEKEQLAIWTIEQDMLDLIGLAEADDEEAAAHSDFILGEIFMAARLGAISEDNEIVYTVAVHKLLGDQVEAPTKELEARAFCLADSLEEAFEEMRENEEEADY